MSREKDKRFLLLGSYLYSLIPFRGDLLGAFGRLGFTLVASAAERDETIERDLALRSVLYEQIAMERDATSPLKDALVLMRYIALIRRIRPQIVLSYTIKPVIYGSIAAALVGVPVRIALITGMGSVFSADAAVFKKYLVGMLYRVSLRFCHVVVFQNEDDMAYFVSRNWVDQKKCLRVMGSGVRISDYSVSGFPARITFTMVSRLLKEKGVSEFLESAREIKAKYPDVAFKLVGWVDDEGKCVSLDVVRRFQAAGVVDYLGRSDNVKQVLEDTSVFVLPTYYKEGVPRTLLEALAAGRPIITTDTPGCADTVVNGWNGFVVRPKSVSDLVRAMEFYVLNGQEIAKMGENSRVHAANNFDVDLVNGVIASRAMAEFATAARAE